MPLGSFRFLKNILLSALLASTASFANDENLQRKTFLQAEKQVWNSGSATYENLYNQLHYYPLQPYLDQKRLMTKINLSSTAEINDFLNKYEGTPLDWPLRKKWLNYLAKRNKPVLFQRFFKATSNVELTCQHYLFQLKSGVAAEKILPKVDQLIIGGGMSYTFAKAMGGEIGKSLVENDYLDVALHLIEKAKAENVKLFLPSDSLNADNFSNDAKTCVSGIKEVPEHCMGLDISDETIDTYRNVLLESKTILWNGPMGVFELENFSKGTKAIGEAVTVQLSMTVAVTSMSSVSVAANAGDAERAAAPAAIMIILRILLVS